MSNRPARSPNHPPLLDRAAQDIGGKTAAGRFTGTREEAQAVLDEIDAKVKAISPSSAPPEGSEGQ